MTDLLNGRIPPNALEFESLVIGVCLIDVRGLNHVKKVFRDNYQVFYDPRHQEIYRAIDYLSSKNAPVDIMTVIQQLRKSETLDMAGGGR